MIKRTQEQWPVLFSEHQSNGLKATEFCSNHNICPNYFSKRRKELVNPETKSSPFVLVNSTTSSGTSTLTLHHEQTSLTIPLTASPTWIANLIQQLKTYTMQMFVDINQIYLHRDPVDFRKTINGLSLIIESDMTLPVFSGTLFVFRNKKRDKLKLLYSDKTGFSLWYKRLKKMA